MCNQIRVVITDGHNEDQYGTFIAAEGSDILVLLDNTDFVWVNLSKVAGMVEVSA